MTFRREDLPSPNVARVWFLDLASEFVFSVLVLSLVSSTQKPKFDLCYIVNSSWQSPIKAPVLEWLDTKCSFPSFQYIVSVC